MILKNGGPDLGYPGYPGYDPGRWLETLQQEIKKRHRQILVIIGTQNESLAKLNECTVVLRLQYIYYGKVNIILSIFDYAVHLSNPHQGVQ
jgi:hypothetical protein